MTGNIYALLVGIDEYVSPVPPLQGCVNDIMAVQEYLQGRVATDGYQLHLRTLLNQNATRQAIINGFQQHLCQASNEDVVFFYFSGHGSQAEAPEEFWVFEPDRLNETLVCYDSRSPGGWDLADKELAKLIAEVAAKNPHVTIIMDCCHSGSGTRGDMSGEIAVRQAPVDRRKRPLDSFIFSLAEANQFADSRSPEENPSGWNFPRGKHIFLSACLDSELAKEYIGDGQRRGAFSYFLLDTLKKANGNLSYRDLFKRTNALVRSKVTAQSPQIEATVLGDLDQPFLGGAIAGHTPYFTVCYHKDHGWVIDGGAVHGISQPVGDETTLLALFAFDSSFEQLRQLSVAIAQAKVLEVLPQVSKVQISGIGDLNTEMTFKAVVTSLPLPPKGVFITGEEAGIELARTALLQAGPQSQPSLYIREVTTFEETEFQLVARDGKYLITRPADDRPLVAEIQGYTTATALQVIQRLEHIARWTNIAELSSPASSRISPDAVQMVIEQNGQERQDVQLRLEYVQENGRWKSPSFRIKLKNTAQEPLYCALLDLTDRYAVSASLFDGGGLWLQPGQEAWALGGNSIYPTVPEKLWREQGITEVKDILKLLVSTAEFDATLLEQPELDLPSRSVPTPRRGQGTLNRLMNRIPSRDLRAKPEEEELYDDWVSSQITITTVRPQQTTLVPKGDASIALAAGVQLYAHPSLNANARLTTLTHSTRDLGNHMLPPMLRAAPGIESFRFNTTTRSAQPPLDVLELTQVENASVVTPTDPLKLVVDTPLLPNEQLLPISYDGEFFLPLGRAHRTFDGKTEIILERLTEPVSEGNRSLGGSIKILFQKVITKQLGLNFNYPLLAVADVRSDEVVNYTNDVEQVKARVAQAKRIVLYIHGIIGDTQSMVPSVHKVKVEVDGQEKTLANLYDLVLTFDYENLNTSIEENAKLLKQKLAAVGLGANHGKVLHIVAHSMGGLVSRWFIEREAGHQIVQHLMMLGTPNAGSPWSTVQDWALTTLSLGLNGLSEITWPVPVVGMLLKLINKTVDVIESIDVSLDQMHPNSEFLQNLAASPDPKIPYTIIAGNTSIIPAALQSEANQQFNRVERLVQKLFNRVVAMPFLGQPNDIAVTVDSIKGINSERHPQPQIHEVACDHLVYFIHPAGLTALATAVIQAREEAYQASTLRTPTQTTAVSTPVVNTTTNSTPPAEVSKPKWLIGIVIAVLAGVAMIGLLFSRQKSNDTQPNNQSSQSRVR
ncbi:caspase [Nostocales cyanobacterium HT-58-2]|nr:caspase [Nostocales cyanobacterium HT-58-2]